MPMLVDIDFKKGDPTEPVYITEAIWEEIVEGKMMNSILGEERYSVLLEKQKNAQGKQTTVLSTLGRDFLRKKLLHCTEVDGLLALDMVKVREEWGRLPVTRVQIRLSNEGKEELLGLMRKMAALRDYKSNRKGTKKREHDDTELVIKREKAPKIEVKHASTVNTKPSSSTATDNDAACVSSSIQKSPNVQKEQIVTAVKAPHPRSSCTIDDPETEMQPKAQSSETMETVTEAQTSPGQATPSENLPSDPSPLTAASKVNAMCHQPTPVASPSTLRGVGTLAAPIVLDDDDSEAESEDVPLCRALRSHRQVPKTLGSSPESAPARSVIVRHKPSLQLTSQQMRAMYGDGSSTLTQCVDELSTMLKAIRGRSSTNMAVLVKDTARQMHRIDYENVLNAKCSRRSNMIKAEYARLMNRKGERLNTMLLYYLFNICRVKYSEEGQLRDAATDFLQIGNASCILNNVSRLVLYGGHPCILIAYAVMLAQLNETPQVALGRMSYYTPTIAFWMQTGDLPYQGDRITIEKRKELSDLHRTVFLKLLAICQRKWHTYASTTLTNWTRVEHAILTLADHPRSYTSYLEGGKVSKFLQRRYNEGDIEIKPMTVYGETSTKQTFAPLNGQRAIDKAKRMDDEIRKSQASKSQSS